MAKSFITSIGTANPSNRIKQDEAADFMVSVLPLKDGGSRWLRQLYRATGIKSRYSVLPDYVSGGDQRTFYPDTPDLEPFPSVEDRMRIYQEHALPLSLKAIGSCVGEGHSVGYGDVTHLITVSCTGMYAPGLDIEIMESLGLRQDLERTAVNFMGCYAAFNALKLANHICVSNRSARVLIVCVELCTLHFQKNLDKDNLVANALFGDGAAAALVEPEPRDGATLAIREFHSAVIPEGRSDMAWKIGNFGFEMRLSTYVPELLKGNLEKLVDRAFKKDGRKPDFDLFAIHPGGRKILEAAEQELEIDCCDNRFAHHVLEEFGNMSSPTVLFVLKDLLEEMKDNHSNQHILGLAFGPGLTTEMATFQIM